MALLWWTTPTTGICRIIANRIKDGMSKEEVENMIGVPMHTGRIEAKELSRSDLRRLAAVVARERTERPGRVHFWVNDHGMIRVRFDDQERAMHALYVSFQESWPDKLGRWLHLD